MDLAILVAAGSSVSAHIIPYAIILANTLLFKLLRSLINGLFAYYLARGNWRRRNNLLHFPRQGKARILKLFADELVSTCELCADCAELNVVYERDGALAYGLLLFLLSYLWTEAFGEAQTTPAYLVEEYLLESGRPMLGSADAYARFIGQSLAAPLAWRFASFYWKYQLLSEHQQMLLVENCKSSLTTSTTYGLAIELGCCFICRLVELVGHRLLESSALSRRAVSLVSSFVCTTLVVLALELSGGYFNPILAASLEFGCKGIRFYQHALVFWLGPILGHLLARSLFKALAPNSIDRQTPAGQGQSQRANRRPSEQSQPERRLTRSSFARNTKQAID